jgi:hypothetical protein
MQSAGQGLYQAKQATLTTPGTGLGLSGARGLNNVTYVFSASGATSCTLNVDTLLSDGVTWVSTLTTPVTAASGVGCGAIPGVHQSVRINIAGIAAGSILVELRAYDGQS